MHPRVSMGEDDRKKLSSIDETLKKLRAWWQDPSKMRTDYEARTVSAADAQTHQQNVGLINELKELEAERARIQAQVMDGQPANAGEIDALGARSERLRLDFSALMT
jgi:hypothetical protein